MILNTKFHIPQPRREILIERPLISEMLNEGLQAKLTVLTAPGGYGKTTALSQWVETSGTTAFWISLDQYDNDISQFWSYVITTIAGKNPYFAEAVNPYLSTLTSGNFVPFITVMVHEFSSHSEEWALILDDYHTITLPSIHASIAFLIERLPANIHLFIASRVDLPIPTARLQSISQIVKITIQHLRFELEEGIRYFRDCMGFTLSENDIAQLVYRTEGWISGLHLAAISLKNSDNYPDFIHAFNGEHRSISDYLFQEVLSQQSEEIQTFLLETSFLERMNSALCEAVTGESKGQVRLEMLEQQNLFLIPLDEQRRWYRYHQLFSEFLRRQYRQRHPDRVKQLYFRAANWQEEQGLFEEAVEYFLSGGHYQEAASLIEKHLLELKLKSGVLCRWFSLLPDSCLAGRPEVQFLYVKVLSESEEMEQAGYRLRNMEGKLSDPEWKPFIGTFLYLSAIVSFYRKDFQRANDYLERFEQHMPEGSYIQMIEANVYTVNFDSLLVFFNDLHEAERFFSKWIKVWENKQDYPFVGFFYLAYSELMYEWNRLAEAEVYAERALRQKCMQPYALILIGASINVSRIYQANGELAKAFEVLEQVKMKIDSPDKSIFVKMLDAEKAYLLFANGSLDDLITWLQTYGIEYNEAIPLYRIRKYLLLARALTESGSVNEALQLLEQLYQLAEDEDRLRDKIQVSILQSIAFHRKGDAINTLIKLEAALQMAEPGEYLRSFIDEGTAMANLLSQYLHQRQNQLIRTPANISLKYVKKLLRLLNVKVDETLVSGSVLTMQELRILRMIAMGLSNKQMAEQLQVTMETIKSHLKNIYRKLEVNSRWQAVQRGKALKLFLEEE